MTNARPTMAGLNIFMPSPPNTSLPIPMATTAPINPTYQGAAAGRESPRINPVTTAERSIKENGPSRRRVNRASAARLAATQINSCLAASQPKTRKAAATTGMRAISTSSIIPRVVVAMLDTWGDGAT